MRSPACLLAVLIVALPAVSEAAGPPAPDPLPAFLVGSGTMLVAPSIGATPAVAVALVATSVAPTLLTGALLLNPLVWMLGAAVVALPVTWITALTISWSFEEAGHRPDFVKTWLVGAGVGFVGLLASAALIASGSGIMAGILLLGGFQYAVIPFVQTFVAARFPLAPVPAVEAARPESPGNR